MALCRRGSAQDTTTQDYYQAMGLLGNLLGSVDPLGTVLWLSN